MIKLVENDKAAFFETTFNIYDDTDNYVAPMKSDIFRFLDAKKNPLFSCGNPFKFWVVFEGGKPVGRIIANIHRQSNELHSIKRAQFGFFDCKNDDKIAKILLDVAAEFASEYGMTELVGNFNLTAMQQAGIVTEGFGVKTYTDMVVNPPYIPKLLEKNGFIRFFPMSTFTLDVANATINAPDYEEFTARGFSFAPILRKDFKKRMEEARIVLNDGFSENPMFVPLTSEEFTFQAQEMMSILDPRLSAIVHHDGKPVGTIICIPDLNGFMKDSKSRYNFMTLFNFIKYRFNRKRAVIIFYSVAKEFHKMGINPAMLGHVIKALKVGGYEELGITWIADINKASLRQIEKIGAKKLQGLHLFKKEIS